MEDREDIVSREESEMPEKEDLQTEEVSGPVESSEGTGVESAKEETSERVELEADKDKMIEFLRKENEELKERYLRIYAEFENYKKMVAREREEILRYSNESLINAIIPSIDNLEMALKHIPEGANDGLVKGVELTLKEILRVLERAGLTQIDSLNKTFDPRYHEAMSMVERDDVEPMTVVEEFRKGYMYRDKVLRPSLVAVSKRPENTENQ